MLVNMFQARNRLSSLIKAAISGETVVIANRGEPVVRLVPVEREVQGAGDIGVLLDWLDANPLPGHLRRSIEETEAYIENERASWD